MYSTIYICIVKPLWSTWLSTHCCCLGCTHKVECSIPDVALFLYYIITIIVTNYWSLVILLDSLYLEIPTGFLPDSYWIPCTGLLLDSYQTPLYPFRWNPQFLVIPVGIY